MPPVNGTSTANHHAQRWIDSIVALKPIVHRQTLGANLGSFYSRVVGLNDPATGIPTNMLLYPQALDAGAQPPVQGLGNFPATGPLGSAYAPFLPGSGGDLQKNMRLTIAQDRLDERRECNSVGELSILGDVD